MSYEDYTGPAGLQRARDEQAARDAAAAANPAAATPVYVQREDARTGQTITTPNPANPEGARLIDQQWAAAGVAAGERPAYPLTPSYNDPYLVENTFRPAAEDTSAAAENLRLQLAQAAVNREVVKATWTPPEAPSSDMNSREKINAKLGSISGIGALQQDSMATHLQIGGPDAGYHMGGTDYAIRSGGNIQYGDIYSRAIGQALNMGALFDAAPAIYANRDVAMLSGQELMRQQKVMAGDTKAAQFYAGDLANNIKGFTELSEAYHAAGMKSGKPTPANPYEYRGDLSVEFLKGLPINSNYMFSPVSGEMSRDLPKVNGKGYGLQQWQWDTGLNTDKPQKYGQAPGVSFLAAIQKLGQSGSEYGPYGALSGAIQQRGRTLGDFQADLKVQLGKSLPAPFKSSYEVPAGPKNPPGTPAPGKSWVDNAIGMLKGPILIGNAGGFGVQAAGEGDQLSTIELGGLKKPYISTLYQKRSDLPAVLGEGALSLGDALLKPFSMVGIDYQPGRTLLEKFGQSSPTRQYGAFSDWAAGAQKAIAGSTPEQFEAYEKTSQFKNSHPIVQFQEGIFKAATNPERLLGSTLQGIEFYAGGELLGLGVGALAPAGGAVPAGAIQTIAKGMQTLGRSGITQAVVASGFVGLTGYNDFKGVEPSKGFSNLGGSFVDLTAMLGAGTAMSRFGVGRSVLEYPKGEARAVEKGLYSQPPKATVRPELNLPTEADMIREAKIQDIGKKLYPEGYAKYHGIEVPKPIEVPSSKAPSKISTINLPTEAEMARGSIPSPEKTLGFIKERYPNNPEIWKDFQDVWANKRAGGSIMDMPDWAPAKRVVERDKKTIRVIPGTPAYDGITTRST
jgi:hypothetical protein